jgi:hypothetical protein
MTRKATWTILWGYAVEIIGTGAVYGLALACVGGTQLTKFVQDTADEWNDLTGVLFSAALAIWLTFINIRGSLFGDYLARMRGDAVYSRAFLTAMLSFFLATVMLIACKGTKLDAPSHAAFALLVYSGINLASMVGNATDMVKLYSAFNRAVEMERTKSDLEPVQPAESPR